MTAILNAFRRGNETETLFGKAFDCSVRRH
jgi:hypothetical protein